ncbi:hypothetical protein [Mycolicibacterium gilvum]|uniref:hypothetical protein n=1 Tax=Mycolicibacterium gilvum TaxID=1804 RepID=UPI0021F3509B|nr:hypothetical protein [Mycolicibacterium gilvum]
MADAVDVDLVATPHHRLGELLEEHFLTADMRKVQLGEESELHGRSLARATGISPVPLAPNRSPMLPGHIESGRRLLSVVITHRP